MKRITVFLLTAVLLSTLAGCGEPVPAEASHFLDGYAVVYREDNPMEAQMAAYLFSKLSALAKDVTLATDEAEPTDKEIVLGTAAREGASEAAEGLTAGHGLIRADGSRFLLAGGTSQMVCYAADEFLTAFAAENTAPTDDVAVGTPVACAYKEITNPVWEVAADPWITRRDDTFYYCWTTTKGIKVQKISNLDEATEEGGVYVWRAPEEGPVSKELWAPELHYLNGEWYIYFAADDGSNVNHRMYVLKGTSQDPTEPFEFVGQIFDAKNQWAIDGTVMTYHDELYFVWSSWTSAENQTQRIAIAHMSDPTTIDGKRFVLSSPARNWETKYAAINEGPVALVDGDNARIVYSGSAGWKDDYCIGEIVLTGDELTNHESWTKCEKPLMEKKKGAYGPGHCSFVRAFDGTLWIVYHAHVEFAIDFGGRSGRLQPVFYNGEILITGDPAAPGETVYLPLPPS